jgi:phosphate transport system permease protein
VGVPVSFGIALVITELAPRWLKRPIGVAIELLAAIPSIIYGMWGLFVFAPAFAAHLQPWLTEHIGSWPILGLLFEGPPMGIGMLTAGLILAIMIIPFIISISREVLMAVPVEQREAALALGATKWESTWKVVVPFARAGILGSIFLAMARALGETMAVTMVIGNDPKITSSLFAPGYSIAAVIANEFTEATSDLYINSLIELGLVLFILTFILNGLARLLILATQRKGTAQA